MFFGPDTMPRAPCRVQPGDAVTVTGDGAVGLLAVLSARRLGAEQIILMVGIHPAPTSVASSAHHRE
jgi:threonine dehydrogenase-like Zn-dependent dehydrogenase